MTECQALDLLITPYVDDEAGERERQIVEGHLAACAACRGRVAAESSARHTLRTHAALARTRGGDPAWRPRTFRLGKPSLLAAHPAAFSAAAAAIAVIAVVLLRPASVSAIGVIGDSHCGLAHRYTAQNDGDNGLCTTRCVAHGAKFVLVAGNQIVPIANQDFPDLPRFANARVELFGTRSSDGFTISRLGTAP